MNPPVFSRRVSSPLAGKCDVPAKTMLTEETAYQLSVYARLHGYKSTADCLREMVEVMLYGPEHVVSLHRERIDALAQNWPKHPLEQGGSGDA
jgi:hypothetical protein